MTVLRSLAHPLRATPGRCAICGAPATSWHRTGLAAGGLTRAARACAAHERDVVAALKALTLDECVQLTRRRAQAARTARARANRLEHKADQYARQSAALAGASSATHSTFVVAGYYRQQATVLRAYADALECRQEGVR